VKILRFLVLAPLAIIVMALAVANRGAVTLSLSPLPFEIIAPLYGLLLAALFLGLLVGGFVVWSGRLRRSLRARRARSAPAQTPLDNPSDLLAPPDDSTNSDSTNTGDKGP
jgi:uncharacterized integral membrane protein